MPTIRQNISYAFDRLSGQYRKSVLHLIRAAVILLAVALFLEIFIFNINYFRSLGYETIDLNDEIHLRKDDGQFQITAVNHAIEFSNLNVPVHNLHIDFDSAQPAQNLELKISFTDEAHQTYFDSTEYTVGVPTVWVSTMSSASEYISLNTTGDVGSLRIELVGDDISYPIKLTSISLNAHYPFSFSMLRFGVVLGVLVLIYMFRPNSAIYRINIVEQQKRSKAGIITAVAVEICLVSTYLFFGSNLVGVATPQYNYGSWDGSSIVNVFEVGGENAQQYAELAKSLAKGQLYLDEEPPQWLQAMDDPYDKGARDEAQKETGEPYLFDVAYYQGHYYVYFGIVPVIMFYLPFYLVTGANFPTAIGVLVMGIAFILGCSALLDRFARYHFKQVSLGLYLLLQVPLIACSGILYLFKFPTFYSLPIMSALGFSVWGLYCWMRGRSSAKPIPWFLLGSLCMALVAGCRPQLMALSLLAFPLFWRSYVTDRHLFTKQGVREFISLVVPYVVVAIGLMAYNYARFGSVSDFGANYNLTMNDMTLRGMNIGRLAPAIFSFFLQPPTASGVFPFIQAAPFETTYMGQTVREVTFGGIFACLPILWVLLFTGHVLKQRSHQRSTRTIFGVIVVLLVSGVLIALLDAELAGILQRYYADFSFMFLAAAVLLYFIINENLQPQTLAQRVFYEGLIVVVSLSVLYSVLLCFIPETGWYSDIYPWAYQDIIELVEFWT